MNKYSKALEAVNHHEKVTVAQTEGPHGVLERIDAYRRFYENCGPKIAKQMIIDIGNLQAVLRTLANFGGTIEQARALAGKAVEEQQR